MAKTHTSNVICVCWPTLYTWPDETLAQTISSKRKYEKKTDQTKTKSWGFTATTEKTKAEIETDVANEPGYVPQRYVGTTTPPIYLATYLPIYNTLVCRHYVLEIDLNTNSELRSQFEIPSQRQPPICIAFIWMSYANSSFYYANNNSEHYAVHCSRSFV